jgi:hypothetical protein
VSHTDPEILALRALGETAGTGQDGEHVATCPQCRADLARLAEIIGLARAGGPPGALDSPPPGVWEQIAAAVGRSPALTGPALTGAAGAGAAGAGADEPSHANGPQPGANDMSDESGRDGTRPAGAASGRGPGRRRRRGRLVTAAAGLAAGLIIGIGGTAGVVALTRAPAASVVAQIELSPLPQFPQWQGARGTAVMKAEGGQRLIAVTLDAPKRSGFYEVWLLARNGISMISLGDLNTEHTGTFTIPPGTDLRTYSRIDVSLQPFDGSTVHVKASVVRGSLPAAALG